MKPLHASVIAVVAGIITGVFAARLVAVPVIWAVILALPVAALTLLAALLAGVATPNWQPTPTPDGSLTLHQASALASRFAEATRDRSRFQARIQPRLAQLALSVLRQRPGMHDMMSLRDERAKQALGADLHTVLTNRDATMPSPHRLAELLSRLEEK